MGDLRLATIAAADEQIVALAAAEDILAMPAIQHVVVGRSVDDVVAILTPNHTAGEFVGAIGADEHAIDLGRLVQWRQIESGQLGDLFER